MKFPAPNRVAAYLTAAAALCGALAPAVANLDLTSTVGILGGIAAVLTVFREWLKGWRDFENRPDTPAIDDDDQLPADPEHPDAAGLPAADPDDIPKDKGDPGLKAVAA